MTFNHEMDAPNAPIPRITVELPGPAPFSQATQLTTLRLPQSVYISMIKAVAGISNGFLPPEGLVETGWEP
ncbi:hypothetical protein CXX84_11160 [Arthrobacter sp. AFG7.2]|nr:hypothetical protein CXX84_11160 [Arthrobacter sp. AFG7.2]